MSGDGHINNSRKQRVISAVVLVFVGMGLIGIGCWMWADGQRLKSNGVETDALIISKSEKRRLSRSNNTKSTYFGSGTKIEYKVKFRFDAIGEIHHDQKSVSADYYDSVRQGERVYIRYLDGDPSINEIEIGNFQFHSWIAIGFGIMSLLGALGFIFIRSQPDTKFGSV